MDELILIEVDATGRVLDVRGGAAVALGANPAHLVDRHLTDCVNPGDAERLRLGLGMTGVGAVDGTAERSVIVRLLDDRGRSVWVDLAVGDDDPRNADATTVLHARPFPVGASMDLGAGDADPYHVLVQESADIVMTVDPNGMIRFANSAMERWLATGPEALIGTQVLDLIHPDDHDIVTDVVVRLLDDPRHPQPFEFRARHADGTYRWVDGWLQNLLGHPDVGGLLGNGRDVTERHHAQAELAASEARFRSLASSSPSAIFELDDTGVVRFANTRWHEVTGRVVTGTERIFSVLHSDDRTRVRLRWQAVRGRQGLDENVRVVRPDGTIRWVELRTRPVPGARTSDVTHVGSLHDVTELRTVHQELEYLASHDSLTGLPNRGRLLDRLDAAIDEAARRGHLLALLFVDLDRFKIVNDSLGHHAGDQVLLAIAGRLGDLVRPMDEIARFGGDEFVVLCAPIDGDVEAATLADRIRRETSGAVEVDGATVHVTVSVGYVTGDGTASPESLLRDADAAMYEAKTRGRDRAQAFDEAMHRAAVERLGLESALRRGLERGEFEMFFQPIVEPVWSRVCGVEALLRWRHPERGLLTPEEFLGVAEESGVLAALDWWVLTTACGHAASWSGPTGRAVAAPSVFVNLTAAQLDDPALVEMVADVLAGTGLEPGRLVVEVTEGMLMREPARVAKVLRALRALEVHVAIDDFGTGYSSMSHLTRLPVDVLKIDRSFVAALAESATDREIAAAIIALAHALGLDAVAEGVEDPAQLAVLADLGCDLAQGFLFSEPLPGDRVRSWLAEHADGVLPLG